MFSVIFSYIDNNHEEQLSVSSYQKFINDTRSDLVKQLIRIVYLEHDEERRYQLTESTTDEIFTELMNTANDTKYQYFIN